MLGNQKRKLLQMRSYSGKESFFGQNSITKIKGCTFCAVVMSLENMKPCLY